MTTYLILASCATFGAIALKGNNPSSLKRWLGSVKQRFIAAPPAPIIIRDSGWQFVRCDDVESFEQWLDKDEQGMPFRPGEEPSLGSHLLIELMGCDKASLEEEKTVASAMHEAAVESEATVVTHSFHEFKPYGVSGAVIIQESHYTIHTWPEHGYAAVDLFYCGGTVLVHNAVEVLRQRFQPTKMKFLVVRRGLQSEVE